MKMGSLKEQSRSLLSGLGFNPSGGWVYHRRAAKYRDTLWLPFRQSLESWLLSDEAVPLRPGHGSGEILLVGPSGGHCLPSRFFKDRFPVVRAIDPDLPSRFFFERQHGQTRAWARRADFLPPAEWPKDSPLLFCNLLGQLRDSTAGEPGDSPRLVKNLEALIEDRNWASFHDRLSGTVPLLSRKPWIRNTRASSQELAERYFDDSQGGELADHGAEDWLPALSERPKYWYWIWELSPGRYHIIEGC